MHRFLSGLLLFALLTSSVAFAEVGAFSPTSTPVSPAGVRATIDLPKDQHMQNTGGMGRRGPGTGAGLCVFTSMEHSARWQNILSLAGFQKWMTNKPGGGWPAKVDAMLKEWCKEKGIAMPAYVQHTGGDTAFLELALRTGRCPCVTYSGRDDFYSSDVAHMVNILHLDYERACILDNNRAGTFLWMTRAEFETRWRAMDGGWAIVFLDAPPPPYPGTPTAFAAASCPCTAGEPCECESDCTCASGRVFGQQSCPGGICRPILRPASMPSSPPPPIGEPPGDEYEWRAFEDGHYGWRFKEPRPAEPPTGVVSDKIHLHPAYTLNGREVSKDQAHAALGSTSLADDSDRWHLSAVGDASFLQRFRADVEKLPAAIRAKLLVQAYLPAAWQAVQFQLPAGVVLRKPTVGRVSSNVGTIAAAEYSSQRLDDLLGDAAGPAPRPKPPGPNDTPSPAAPSIPWKWIVGGVALFLFTRKK